MGKIVFLWFYQEHFSHKSVADIICLLSFAFEMFSVLYHPFYVCKSSILSNVQLNFVVPLSFIFFVYICLLVALPLSHSHYRSPECMLAKIWQCFISFHFALVPNIYRDIRSQSIFTILLFEQMAKISLWISLNHFSIFTNMRKLWTNSIIPMVFLCIHLYWGNAVKWKPFIILFETHKKK